MKRLRIDRLQYVLMLAAVMAVGAAHASFAASSAADRSVKQPAVRPLNIQGFRVGMTVSEVKRLLKKRKVSEYATGFSDVFVYRPAPDVEMKLVFSCGERGNVLGYVELTARFSADEAGVALAQYRKQLETKYGSPVRSGSQNDGLDLCWGQCEQRPGGTRLEARTTGPQDRTMALELTLSDPSRAETCKGVRRKKIDSWLLQWIASVQKYGVGMSLREASKTYQKYHEDELVAEEQRDEASGQYTITNYVAKDNDYFDALDPDSQMFEGAGPGSFVLKFTGDGAGACSRLNKKLYYLSCSTTSFSDEHLYPGLQQKLDRFVKRYGKPDEINRTSESITASWRKGQLQRSVSIHDSGLITFEQSDPSLREAYREAALKRLVEYGRTRFEKSIF